MRRLATVLGPFACATCVVVAGAPLASATPRGRVVRVERQTVRDRGTPRLCTFETSMTTGQCYGKPIEVGETVTLVSVKGVVGRLRITHVTPEDSTCGAPGVWTIDDGELDRTFAPPATMGTAVMGVVDGALDVRRARAVMLEDSPSGRASDSEFFGFDTDGDGTADLMFDHFVCDAQGHPSNAVSAQCWETWTTDGAGWPGAGSVAGARGGVIDGAGWPGAGSVAGGRVIDGARRERQLTRLDIVPSC